MSAVPIGVTVLGWPENTWAIEYPRPPREWTRHDLTAFMGGMSRCLPPRVSGDCMYELRAGDDGLTIRVWRGERGEARTYSALDVPRLAFEELLGGMNVTNGSLSLDDQERAVADALILQPMGGAV